MARKRYAAEDIIGHLRTIEIETGKGLAVADACRKLGITEQTYYRWKKEYGGLRVDQAKRLKGLEQENARLKRLVADLSLDNSILKEVAAGNFSARPDAEKPSAMRRRGSRSRNAGRVAWWGNVAPRSSIRPFNPMTRTPCGRASSPLHGSMGGTGIGGSRRCCTKKAGV